MLYICIKTHRITYTAWYLKKRFTYTLTVPEWVPYFL